MYLTRCKFDILYPNIDGEYFVAYSRPFTENNAMVSNIGLTHVTQTAAPEQY